MGYVLNCTTTWRESALIWILKDQDARTITPEQVERTLFNLKAEQRKPGTIHPYFSPECFSSVECRVEWWHWLSRDYFVHSNQCWYSLQYGIATDSNLVTYHDVRAIFNFDINSYVSVGAEARALNSSEYDMYSAMAYVQIRFLSH